MNQPASARTAAPGSGRLMSLDVFRGATIASMMLVNNPGSWDHVYGQLDHAEWNGWTFTDLIFPFFLWIVGVAVPLSTAKRLERGERRVSLFGHILRRVVIIFLLGLSLAFISRVVDGSYTQLGGFGPWSHDVLATIRIMGVLQRIAVCYLIASGIYLCTSWRGQAAWIIGLLAGYWLLMRFGPGHSGIWPLTKEENFAAHIDGIVLGKHCWNGAPWDPEGIVSTLPAIGTCLFGILTGQLLQVKRSVEQKTIWLFAAGNVLMFAGAVMNIWLPINKNLWTSSYSVFMAGIAMDIFALIYWLVDVKGWQRGAKPFAVYGMNAITVFMLSGIVGRILMLKAFNATSWRNYLYETVFDGPLSHVGLPPKICSLSWAIAWMLWLYLVAWVMYRRKWLVRF
jgi:predicted acyltransferase